MLSSEFVEFLRRKMVSEEDKRVNVFQKELSVLYADRYSKNMYASSITVDLLADLVITRLEKTASTITISILELHSTFKDRLPDLELPEDIRSEALKYFEQECTWAKEFLLNEARKAVPDHDIEKRFEGKMETAISRIQSEMLLSIDLYAAQHSGVKATIVKASHSRDYVAEQRLTDLRNLKSTKFDFKKLIRMCEEINTNYANGNYLAVGALLRMVLDHIPPVFGQPSFAQVAANFSGGKSFKFAAQRLESESRNISDRLLHSPIRNVESLPEEPQINYSHVLDLVLEEMIRITRPELRNSVPP